MLRDKIRALGVEVLVEKATECIEDGEQARHRLRFKDGSHLETDVLLFLPASAPLTAWPGNRGWRSGSAAASASTTAATARIPPSSPSANARAGRGASSGWWPRLPDGPGRRGQPVRWREPLRGADMSTKLKLMGVDVGSIGDAHASTAGAQELLLLDRVNGIYKKLVTDGEGGCSAPSWWGRRRL